MFSAEGSAGLVETASVEAPCRTPTPGHSKSSGAAAEADASPVGDRENSEESCAVESGVWNGLGVDDDPEQPPRPSPTATTAAATRQCRGRNSLTTTPNM